MSTKQCFKQEESLLSLDEVLLAAKGVLLNKEVPETFCFTSVVTDSRQVSAGSLFVPLLGEKQDGHTYIPQALEKGATVVFVVKDKAKETDYVSLFVKRYPTVFFVAVENTLYALQHIACMYVKKFPKLIKIGITGSSGKTTTKEILAHLLSEKYSVIMNQGNLNSETGLPLSVFAIREYHEVGIFEMGMNRRGEISELASVLLPDVGVITNIGTAHIGILGSKDAIAEEKKEIFSNFCEKNVAFIPEQDAYRNFLAQELKGTVIFYGESMVQHVRSLGLKGTAFSYEGIPMVLPLPGKGNFYDCLAGIAVAKSFGLTASEIKTGLSKVTPLFGRSQVIEGAVTIIQDCYNANPDSMAQAVTFFQELEDVSGRKIAILGDMLELGSESLEAHKKIVSQVTHSSVEYVLLVGNCMWEACNGLHIATCGASENGVDICEKKGPKVFCFDDGSQDQIDKATQLLRKILKKGDVVLLKASRSMALERLTTAMQGGKIWAE